MTKKVFRSIVIFLGIVTIFPLCYLVYVFFTVGEGSYWIFGARDGYASVTAWLDENANGIMDNGEPPFPGVCIWYGDHPDSVIQDSSNPCQFSNYGITDEQGNWWEFLPGGSCEDFYVFTKAPDRYQPTTDSASNGCSAQFGFVENGVTVAHEVLSIRDFAHRTVTILWATRISIGFFIIAVAGFGTYWLEKKI